MFVFFPVGVDDSTAGTPWVTISLIAVCVVVHFRVSSGQEAADGRLVEAIDELVAVAEAYPEAQIDPRMARRLPWTVQPFLEDRLSDLVEASDANLALYDAVDLVARATAAHPLFKYGYRTGRRRWWAPVTSMFMHADWLHLVGNMVFLFLVGSIIESYWGAAWFLALYFAGGLLSVFAFDLATLGTPSVLVGASGAIAAVMGTFALVLPRTRILFYWLLLLGLSSVRGSFRAPAWVALGLWFVWELKDALGGADTGVAYWAHVGGFAAGMLAALAMKRWGPVVTLETRPVAFAR